jgi:NADH-ubiquinone oxidoreductase chain 1
VAYPSCVSLSFVVLICVDTIWLIFISFKFMYYYSFLSLSLSSFVFCLVFPSLAEINQITFDFSEGESELISGFNVEFGGGGLALSFFGRVCYLSLYEIVVLHHFLGGQ